MKYGYEGRSEDLIGAKQENRLIHPNSRSLEQDGQIAIDEKYEIIE